MTTPTQDIALLADVLLDNPAAGLAERTFTYVVPPGDGADSPGVRGTRHEVLAYSARRQVGNKGGEQ